MERIHRDTIACDEIIPSYLSPDCCNMYLPKFSSAAAETISRYRERIIYRTPIQIFSRIINDCAMVSVENDEGINLSQLADTLENDERIFKRFCLVLNDHSLSSQADVDFGHLLAKEANMEYIFKGIES